MKEADMTSSGLTKREMFAMAAMQGLLGSKSFDASKFETGNEWHETLAFAAVEHADSLIAELAEVSA
jgi:hypothetical protein